MPEVQSNEMMFFLVLKSQGVFNSEQYLQKIIQAYPKFIPILNTRIPQNLLPLIWNDPVTQQLASIFSNRQVRISFDSFKYFNNFNVI